jgi:imidazolonepropionase-like amidohydrolase
MKRTSWRLTFLALAPLLGLATAEPADFRIEHVTVISPERAQPLRDATVTVRGDRIVAVGSRQSQTAVDETVIDGKGLYLTPGLIDSHVHLSDVPGMRPQDETAHPEIAKAARAQFPRSYLLYGYTTLVDLISTPQRMAEWKANDVRPDTYFCGSTPVVDGYTMFAFLPPEVRYRQHPYMLVHKEDLPKLPPDIDPSAHTPEAVVARMKADGAFCVKAFSENGFGPASNLPTISLEDARALVRAAHREGMLVFMHANAAESQAFALEAGVDVIAHGMWHWGESAFEPEVKRILDGVVARKVGWQPTMQVLYGERDLLDPDYLSNPALARAMPASLIEWYRTPDGQWFRDIIASNLPKSTASPWVAVQSFYAKFIDNHTASAKYLVQRKAKILFGTDTPSAPTYANPPGLNGFLEMHRLVAAGMTPAEIFRAATLANAEALKLSHEIGTVQVGKRANLLLMREDPTRSVDAYAGITKVIVGGRVLEADELVAKK